jgi:hypothetical protein
MEYYDGKIIYNLPGQWATEINEYAQSRYRLREKLGDDDDWADGLVAVGVAAGVAVGAADATVHLIGCCVIL